MSNLVNVSANKRSAVYFPDVYAATSAEPDDPHPSYATFVPLDRFYDLAGNGYVLSVAGAAIEAHSVLTRSIDTVTFDGVTKTTSIVTYGGVDYDPERVIVTADTLVAQAYLYRLGMTFGGITTGGGQPFKVVANDTSRLFVQEPFEDQSFDSVTVVSLRHVVEISVSTLSPVVGVSPIDVPADYYFWMQVSGIAPVRIHGSSCQNGMPVVSLGGKKGYASVRSTFKGDNSAYAPVIGYILLCDCNKKDGTALVSLTGELS